MSITRFRDEHRFLSNFWIAPFTMTSPHPGATQSVVEHLYGHTAPSSEHFYQAAKTLDQDQALAILRAETPFESKTLGQDIELRPDWDRVKLAVMEEVLAAKFQNDELRDLLRSTGDQPLIEGNHWHDVFWGTCSCDEHDGAGENHLGRLLMELRAGLA